MQIHVIVFLLMITLFSIFNFAVFKSDTYFSSTSYAAQSSSILSKLYQELIYDGYICFLQKTSDYTIDVYLRANENCALQAFDIYIDSADHEFKVISCTGKNIDLYQGHFMSIANNLEMEMLPNTNYKIARLVFQDTGDNYFVSIIRADLAIAGTPFSPKMDDRYLTFDTIMIGKE